MTRRTETIRPAYFDGLYANDPDPWRFATSDYEREKYAATLAALPARPFATALEVGCSIGVLTKQLATRCDSLLALDVAEAALDQARARCPDVRFERRAIPDEWPPGAFDLIVFSEVLYYLDAAGIRRDCGPGQGGTQARREHPDGALPGRVRIIPARGTRRPTASPPPRGSVQPFRFESLCIGSTAWMRQHP